MILHFLKRDFFDFQIGWAFIALVTVLSTVASEKLFGDKALVVFLMVYMLFAIVPTQFILGSVWRTQHQLSRHFLLSLPLPHKRLFFIQNIRMLVFWMPILTWSLVFPLLNAELFTAFTINMWALYYFGIIASFGLIMQMNIWAALEQERISDYLQKSSRIFTQVRTFAIPIGLILVLSQAWENLFFRAFLGDWAHNDQLLSALSQLWFGKLISLPLAEIIFPTSFALFIFWSIRNRRRWCVIL